MWQTGPNTSSRTQRALSGRPVQMVGCTKAPLSRASPKCGTPPPVTTVAPSSTASLK